MNSEIINLEINDVEFEAEVEFNFYDGEPAITNQLPEYCCEGSYDEYEITGLFIKINQGHTTDVHDISFLIEDLKNIIIEQLEGINDET